MSGCTLVASELTTAFQGGVPTFSFTPDANKYLGFTGSYTSAGKQCTFTSGQSFTPVVTAGSSTYTCSLAFGGVLGSITALWCPTLPVNSIPDSTVGTVTIGYTGRHASCAPVATTSFIVGPGPSTLTNTVYNTITTSTLQTVTAARPYASTATSTAYATTWTQRVLVAKTTSTTTVTSSQTVSSCAPSSSSQGSSQTSTKISSTSPAVSSSQSSSSTSAPSSTSKTSSSSNYPQSTSSSVSRPSSSSSPTILSSSSTSTPSPSSSTVVYTPTSSTSGSSSTSTAIQCPDNDGNLYYTNGEIFQIQCSSDHSGGDLPIGLSPVMDVDFAGCMDACANTIGCVDVSLSGIACYLKGYVTTPVEYDANVWGAARIGYYNAFITVTTAGPAAATSPSPTSSSAAPTGSGVQCPSANSTTFTGTCGSQYVIECSLDRFDSDITAGIGVTYTLDDCIDLCDTVSGCIDVSWVNGSPGVCYPKSGTNYAIYNDAVWGARQVSGCTSRRLKLHRKRNARIEPRYMSYGGPDITYGSTPVTATATGTVSKTSTVSKTVTPAASGTTTATVTTGTAYMVVYWTSTYLSSSTATTTYTTCPKS